MLGMMLGALAGGKLMTIGRRNSQFISLSLGLVGISLTMILNLKVIVIGRFLFGLSVGSFTSTVPKYVEEMVPEHLFDKIAPLFTIT